METTTEYIPNRCAICSQPGGFFGPMKNLCRKCAGEMSAARTASAERFEALQAAKAKAIKTYGNITAARVAFCMTHKAEIEAARSEVIPHKGVTVGKNARYYDGMSQGGWGLWSQALEKAGIKCDRMDYWAGSNPTPSIAINEGIANYLRKNAAHIL